MKCNSRLIKKLILYVNHFTKPTTKRHNKLISQTLLLLLNYAMQQLRSQLYEKWMITNYATSLRIQKSSIAQMSTKSHFSNNTTMNQLLNAITKLDSGLLSYLTIFINRQRSTLMTDAQIKLDLRLNCNYQYYSITILSY